MNEFLAKMERDPKRGRKSIFRLDRPTGGSVFIDSVNLRLVGDQDESLQLTAKEYQIFFLLYANWNQGVPRPEIMSLLWSGLSVSSKVLDVHLFHLRRKLSSFHLDIRFSAPSLYKLEFLHDSDEVNSNSLLK